MVSEKHGMKNIGIKFKGCSGKISKDGKIIDFVRGAIKQASIQNLDSSPENQDWVKILSWDLPPYKSDEFLKQFNDLPSFRALPLYKAAVKAKLIVRDEWKGPKEGYCQIRNK